MFYILSFRISNQKKIVEYMREKLKVNKSYNMYLLLEYLIKKNIAIKQIQQIFVEGDNSLLLTMIQDIQNNHQYKDCIIEIVKELVNIMFSQNIQNSSPNYQNIFDDCLIKREIEALCRQFYFQKSKLDYDENSFYKILREFCKLPNSFVHVYQ